MKLMIQEPELLDGVVKETLSRSLERKYGRLDFPDPVTHFLSSYFYCTPEDLGVVMQSDFLAAAIKNDDPLKYIHAAFAQVNALDQSDQYLWIFQHLHLQGLLARVDMTTMATSVEARVPFVDHELVEFVTTIPFHYKIRWRSLLHQAMATIANADEISERYDIPKYLLRRAFEDVLPSDVVTRKKVGFPVPLHRWFGGQYGAQAREVLLDSSLSKWGIFDRDGIERWLADIQHSEDTRKGIKLWMMMNLGIWLDAYF
jgi:asparagine synthase (glutamine-hydrolysing)